MPKRKKKERPTGDCRASPSRPRDIGTKRHTPVLGWIRPASTDRYSAIAFKIPILKMNSILSTLPLFGGDKPWSPLDWTSSDDRVRGGTSYSELSCKATESSAVFHGNLDIKTLGGAGFASQRTTGEDRSWDVSKYNGIVLDIEKSDDKRYTLILKDELLPKSPNGREQSTVSWEFDFKPDPEGGKIYVTWDELKPTYRGRERRDTKPLNLREVRRFSLMMRSFFGTQEGEFCLSIRSLAAFRKSNPYIQQVRPYEAGSNTTGEVDIASKHHGQRGWLSQLFRYCLGL